MYGGCCALGPEDISAFTRAIKRELAAIEQSGWLHAAGPHRSENMTEIAQASLVPESS